MNIKYSEIFHSVQGEGSLVGTPSVFFRTSYCNLRCSWCDTPYTSHKPENKDIDIEEAIDKICAYDCDHVVITGGEPFIQEGQLRELCEGLSLSNKHITIETNGTICFPVIANLISCSPKTRNSFPTLDQVSERGQERHEKLRYNPKVLKTFIKEYHHQFKFVINTPEDLVEIKKIVEDIGIDPQNVFLMPEGRTTPEILQKEYWVIEKCIKLGYRYSDRLQVRLWSDRRGV